MTIYYGISVAPIIISIGKIIETTTTEQYPLTIVDLVKIGRRIKRAKRYRISGHVLGVLYRKGNKQDVIRNLFAIFQGHR